MASSWTVGRGPAAARRPSRPYDIHTDEAMYPCGVRSKVSREYDTSGRRALL